MSGKLLDITDANYSSTISTGITIVDFWAPWCGPCRMQTPILEDLVASMNLDAKVGKMNVDENPNTSATLGIRSIPTLILFKNGNEIERFIGVQTKETLISAISKNK